MYQTPDEVVSVLRIKIVILPNIVLNIDRCEGEERNLSSFCSASEALSPSTWFHPFSNESLVFPVVCPGVISWLTASSFFKKKAWFLSGIFPDLKVELHLHQYSRVSSPCETVFSEWTVGQNSFYMKYFIWKHFGNAKAPSCARKASWLSVLGSHSFGFAGIPCSCMHWIKESSLSQTAPLPCLASCPFLSPPQLCLNPLARVCDSLADDLTPYRVACVPNPETCSCQWSCLVLLNQPSDPSLSSFTAKCR